MTEQAEPRTHLYQGKIYRAVYLTEEEKAHNAVCTNCAFRNNDAGCVDAPDCSGLNWVLKDV